MDRSEDPGAGVQRQDALDMILALTRRLKPTDRQVILLYLEGLDAASIADITGVSSAHVAVKISRIKGALTRLFQQGVAHAK